MKIKIIDSKLKGHLLQYIIQCLLATVSLGVVLFYMDIFLNTAIVASIGATSFIIFTMPHRNNSKAYYILGGYAVSTIIGVLFNILLLTDMKIPPNAIGAAAVGLTMLVMVITNTEHPPAAGLALGIAISGYTYEMLGFVYAVALLLILIKRIFKRWLIDLL